MGHFSKNSYYPQAKEQLTSIKIFYGTEYCPKKITPTTPCHARAGHARPGQAKEEKQQHDANLKQQGQSNVF